MNANLQVNDKVEVQPAIGEKLQCQVTRVERRAMGFNYFAVGVEPGRRVKLRIVLGIDGNWAEYSQH